MIRSSGEPFCEQAALAGAEVDRLRVVGDQRERGLLGLGGVAVGDVHADVGEAEQPLDLQVLGLLGHRGVAPGVAPALRGGDAEHRAGLVVQPLGQALGGLHAEAVDEQLLGELAFGLELGHQLGHLRAHGHRLHRDHVQLVRAATGRVDEDPPTSPSLHAGRKKSARQMRSPFGWRGQTKRVSSVVRSSGSSTTISLPSA